MMDAYQGYHQVKMNPPDIPKAAFGVYAETFGFQSMPFGLKECWSDIPKNDGQNIQKPNWEEFGGICG